MTVDSSSKRINLHVHSVFSDGQYTPETLVLQALDQNISVIGLSDHYDTSKTLSIDPGVLPEYLDELDRLADCFISRIRILKGIEINLIDMFLFDRALPEPGLLKRLDYVLLEYVANIPRIGIPLLHASLIAQKIPVPTGLAHTDLEMAFPGMPPDECVEKLVQSGFFLELNESYHRPGENKPFYTHYTPYLQTRNASSLQFSAGTDSHGSLNCATAAIAYLESLNLAGNLFFNNL